MTDPDPPAPKPGLLSAEDIQAIEMRAMDRFDRARKRRQETPTPVDPLDLTLEHRKWGPADARESSSLTVHVNADGSLRICNVEAGPQVERDRGDFDDESWIDIPAADAPRFAAVVLREWHTGGKPAGLAGLEALCRANGIRAERGGWT